MLLFEIFTIEENAIYIHIHIYNIRILLECKQNSTSKFSIPKRGNSN